MAPSPGTIPALVLGSEVTALGATRALGRRGIPLLVASGSPGVERWSRWYRPAPGDWAESTLDEALRTTSIAEAVLIPCSDHAAIEVAELPGDLRTRFHSSVADADVLTRLLDKARLSSLLDQHGIAHARTWRVDDRSELDRLEEARLRSVFIKPRDTQSFMAAYGVKSLTPSGRDEIWAALTEVRERGIPAMLQEYVPGPVTNGYLLDGFVDRAGSLRGLLARRRLRMHPEDFGNSSAARTVPLDEAAPAVDAIPRLLEGVRYRGIFSVEFKKDERDGSFRLLDFNPRAWWQVEFAARCGLDTVYMAYQDALGLDVPSVESYDVGRTIIYPYYDLFACARARRAGEMSLREWAASWLGADQMIFARDDPLPSLNATLGLWAGYIGRRLGLRGSSA